MNAKANSRRRAAALISGNGERTRLVLKRATSALICLSRVYSREKEKVCALQRVLLLEKRERWAEEMEFPCKRLYYVKGARYRERVAKKSENLLKLTGSEQEQYPYLFLMRN